jgi:hypothetical protein
MIEFGVSEHDYLQQTLQIGTIDWQITKRQVEDSLLRAIIIILKFWNNNFVIQITRKNSRCLPKYSCNWNYCWLLQWQWPCFASFTTSVSATVILRNLIVGEGIREDRGLTLGGGGNWHDRPERQVQETAKYIFNAKILFFCDQQILNLWVK